MCLSFFLNRLISLGLNLAKLLCSLFFEAWRDRHSGGISTDEAYITELLLAIREKVAAGVLE